MTAGGKTCIVARAWRMQTSTDTAAVSGFEDEPIGHPGVIPTGTVSNIGVVAISTVFILKPTPTTAKVGARSGLTMTPRW